MLKCPILGLYSPNESLVRARTTRIFLDERVIRPISKPRPSFGYFSTEKVKFSFPNSTTGENFRPLFVLGKSYRPTD